MNMASADEIGQVQGSLTALLTLTGGVGPILFSQVFKIFSKPVFGLEAMPYMPYVLTILSNVICTLLVSKMRIGGLHVSESCELPTAASRSPDC